MTSLKILKESHSKLTNIHIEKLITLKPFNNRIVALLKSLESLADKKNNSFLKIANNDVQQYTTLSLK